MDVDKLSIDPWSSTQSTDYSRIIQQFGLSDFNNLTLPDPSHLHRRGIIFAHRRFGPRARRPENRRQVRCFNRINA